MSALEIIKGLNACLESTTCAGCPYYKDPYDEGRCVERLIRDISNRLERLELMVQSDQ